MTDNFGLQAVTSVNKIFSFNCIFNFLTKESQIPTCFFLLYLIVAIGQVISKCPFDVFKSPQNQWNFITKGPFNNYVVKMRAGGGQKMPVFVHAQGTKTVHAGEGEGQKMAKFCRRSCWMPPRNFVLQRLKITVFRFSNFMININYKYQIPSKFSKIYQNPEVQEHCVNPDLLTCWDIFGK